LNFSAKAQQQFAFCLGWRKCAVQLDLDPISRRRQMVDKCDNHLEKRHFDTLEKGTIWVIINLKKLNASSN